MALSLNEIKMLSSVDLENFEIRGAKYGVGNARTTGPMYVEGTYFPSKTRLYGSGVFTSDSSLVSSISFYSPFGFNAAGLKNGDAFIADSTSYTVLSPITSTSVFISANAGFDGTRDFTCTLGVRDYLVEPDSGNNTTVGIATFTSGEVLVNGTGTAWTSDITSNDFIKPDGYQIFQKIKQVNSDTQLELYSSYTGATITGPYQAKRGKIGRQYIRYTKDNFTYEKNSGRWAVTDSTTGSKISTSSTSFLSMADGINLKFTPNLSSGFDLSEVGSFRGKTFAQKTEREISEFSLPIVPNPESSFELYINDTKKDMFPDGNRDYVINYHQDPFYILPPPVAERKVANLLFLDHVTDQTLSSSVTQSGAFSLTDSAGNIISGVMSGSVSLSLDGTAQSEHSDFVLDTDSGVVLTTEPVLNENVVKYVFINQTEFVDHGIQATYNGSSLKLTIPPASDDGIRVVLNTGRVKIMDRDHPAENDEYIIDYLAEGTQVTEEAVASRPGYDWFRTNYYPLKNDSVVVIRNGEVLDEYIDYRVSYLLGRIVLFKSMTSADQISVSYTPLAKQVNGVSYANGKNYTTIYDALLSIIKADEFRFSLLNPIFKPKDIEVIRIFNETKNKDYNLAGIMTDDLEIKLEADSTNVSIGLASTDVVTLDYKAEYSTLEYAPVIPINMVIPTGTKQMVFVGKSVSQFFTTGRIVALTLSDISRTYQFVVASCVYDGEDTVVTFMSAAAEDIINPSIFVTDSSVSFTPSPEASLSVVSGTTQVFFPGNIANVFRPGASLALGSEIYPIASSEYDGTFTAVQLSYEVQRDYTSAEDRFSARFTDCPLYYEGDQVISASGNIITDPQQTAMVLNYGLGKISVSSNSIGITVINGAQTHVFPYSTYPTVDSLTTAMSSAISSLSATAIVPNWLASKIIPQTSEVSADSSSVFYVYPALRLNGTDTTDFSVEEGNLVLSNSLVRNQDYALDYQRNKYLGNSTVMFSADYFTTLPAGSKISASSEYDLLDQFYIEVMSQRQFLETVMEPKAKEEAAQLQGNTAQGGDIPDDENQGNSEGGSTGDEYRRQDTEIECHVIGKIFDFFNDRLQAYSDELYNAIGFKICNNDGLLSDADISMATKAFNRMWPGKNNLNTLWGIDHTNLEPFKANPLVGTAYGPGLASFTNGQATITGVSTKWLSQLDSSDFIRPYDSTTDYQIQLVNNDQSLTLAQPYQGSSKVSVPFSMTARFPLWDDDGHMGAKINGSKESDFGLADQDEFDCYLDGEPKSVKFEEGTGTLDSLSSYTAQDVARTLTAKIPGLKATVEWVYDASTAYGYRNTIVLRTDGTCNHLVLGDGSAVSKCGFVPDTTAMGNLRASDNSAEVTLGSHESVIMAQERSYLDTIIGAGALNKFDRTGYIDSSVYRSFLLSEVSDTSNTQQKINKELAALQVIISEPSKFPQSYAEGIAAIAQDTTYQTDTSSAMSYTSQILSDWQGCGDASSWVLSIDSSRQDILGRNSTGYGVDTSSGSGIVPIDGETWFVLHSDPYMDRRVLNMPPDKIPVARYADNSQIISGTWTGWKYDAYVNGKYSITSDATFTASAPLRALFVDYWTISDANLGDRTNFISSRNAEISQRASYLENTRKDQIIKGVTTEGFLRSADGGNGDLWIWANNRFNRRQGCDARLMQIEAQIAANQSALQVNKTFL